MEERKHKKSLLEAMKLTLDFDKEKNRMILLRGDSNYQTAQIEPKNRAKSKKQNRHYCPRQAYNLAITLSLLIEKEEYSGRFEITSQALEQIRQYETQAEKPSFESCVEFGSKKYNSKRIS